MWSIPYLISRWLKVHGVEKFFVGGRAQMLLGALDYFERRRREMEAQGRGRAGIAPQNQTRTPSRNENEYSRWDEGHFPHGRAGALTVVECLSSRRGRGRGISPPTLPHHPNLQGGEEVEASVLPPPPLKITPHL